MAVIDYKAVNMNALKTQCKVLNESGLLPEPIEIRVGMKKQELADAFVKGIEQCNDIGKLDDVPEAVYTYYTGIVKPEEPATAAAAAAPATEGEAAAPATPPAGKGRGGKKAAPAAKPAAKAPAKKAPAKKAAPATPPPAAQEAADRLTRATAYAQIVSDGKGRTPKQIVEDMLKVYGSNEKQAVYWCNVYNGILLALGKMTKAEDGALTYTG